MLNKRQKKEYDEAKRQYGNLTGWDYMEMLLEPKTVEQANNNIRQAVDFCYTVYCEVQNLVRKVGD